MKDTFTVGSIALLRKSDILKHGLDDLFELARSEDNFIDIF